MANNDSNRFNAVNQGADSQSKSLSARRFKIIVTHSDYLTGEVTQKAYKKIYKSMKCAEKMAHKLAYVDYVCSPSGRTALSRIDTNIVEVCHA